MRRDSLLYVTQADPHDVTSRRSPLSAKRLRTYLIFHSMFFDKLLVGDSQFINNATLRSLIWPDEPAADPGVLADLALLVEHGVLLPAIRNTVGSLHDVWRELTGRQVVGVGSEQYVRYVQNRLDHHKGISYEASAVSNYFRDQVLATFAADNADLHLKASVRQAAYEYVAEQDTLYYIRLRQWLAQQVELGRMTDFQRKTIDKAVGFSYRLNVPKAIEDSQIDVPLNPRQFWMPVDIQLGRRAAGKIEAADPVSLPARPFAVSPHVLGRLPAETLLAIIEDPARRPVMRQLSKFRRTGTVDAEKLNEAVEKYLYTAEQIAYSGTGGELQDLIRRRRRERRRANLTIIRDTGLAVAGLGIWGEVGNVAGYAGLAVTAWASVSALRNYGRERLDGYAVGRMIPPEHRLVLNRPDGHG